MTVTFGGWNSRRQLSRSDLSRSPCFVLWSGKVNFTFIFTVQKFAVIREFKINCTYYFFNDTIIHNETNVRNVRLLVGVFWTKKLDTRIRLLLLRL